MENKPEVSVIIPTFNRARRVVRAVTSVLNQTFRGFEIIVVDDGSNDGTKEALLPLRPQITHILHPRNLGVSAARNTGIKASKLPLIAFLDSDDTWLPEKISVQTAFFRENRNAVACQTQEIWLRHGRRVNPKKKHLKPSGDVFLPSLKQCMVSPSAVMLKRSLLDAVGIFDETLPACEDYDLWLRISHQYPIDLIDQTLVVKEGGASDQLSSRYGGMDRFRIKSLLKLLQSGALSGAHYEAALKELSLKCKIYGEGCLKRGKEEEGKEVLALPSMVKNAGVSSRPVHLTERFQ
ncbi:MAG: glycosyltransferase family A protein [Pseudomonadota bacterium]